MTFDPGNAYVAIVLGLAAAVISTTISKASIFAFFRTWIDRHSAFLGDLFHCPYCVAHWVCLGLTLIFEPLPVISEHFWLDCIVTAFAMTFIASVGHGMIRWAFAQGEDE